MLPVFVHLVPDVTYLDLERGAQPRDVHNAGRHFEREIGIFGPHPERDTVDPPVIGRPPDALRDIMDPIEDSEVPPLKSVRFT